MNIHEYQAKKILSQYGIEIPRGGIAYTPGEAKRVAAEVSKRGPWMLKSQIQSGARKRGYFLEKKPDAAAVSGWSKAAGIFCPKRNKCWDLLWLPSKLAQKANRSAVSM